MIFLRREKKQKPPPKPGSMLINLGIALLILYALGKSASDPNSNLRKTVEQTVKETRNAVADLKLHNLPEGTRLGFDPQKGLVVKRDSEEEIQPSLPAEPNAEPEEKPKAEMGTDGVAKSPDILHKQVPESKDSKPAH